MSDQTKATTSNHDEDQQSRGHWTEALLAFLVLGGAVFVAAVLATMTYHRFMIDPIDNLGADMELQDLPGSYLHCRDTSFIGPINLFDQRADLRVVNGTSFTQDITVLPQGSFVDYDSLFKGKLAPGEDVTVELNLPSPVSDWKSALTALEEPRVAIVCIDVQG